MDKVPVKAFQFRRDMEKNFNYHIWRLNSAWEKTDFKDLKEVARSIMYIAEACEHAWEDGEGAWALKERE